MGATGMIQIADPGNRRKAMLVDKCLQLIYWVGKRLGKKTPYHGSLPTASFRKILVIRLDHIGDVLLTTPLYQALRRKFPKAQLDTLVGSWAAGGIKFNPDIDQIKIYDAPWFQQIRTDQGKEPFRKWRALVRLGRTIRQLAQERYDLVIDPRADLRHLFFFGYLSKARYLLSFDRTGGRYFLSQAVPFQAASHEMDKLKQLVKPLGIDQVASTCQVYLHGEDQAFAKQWLAKKKWEGKQVVAIVPGTRKPLKQWPLERIIELINYLLESDPNMVVVLLGGPGEHPLGKRLKAAFPAQPRLANLINQATLLQSYAVMQQSALVISHDGPMAHMASALSMPLIVLFGPTEVARFRPLRNKVYCLQKKFTCSPCLLDYCPITRSQQKSACMEALAVKEVVACLAAIREGHTDNGG